MKKSIKKIMSNIRKLEREKKSWSNYRSEKVMLDAYAEKGFSEEREYEATLAQIKLYDIEIKRLKCMLAC